MIRESLHFSFDGVKSTNFGIINVRVGTGLYQENVMASKTVEEVQIAGRRDPYFLGVNETPKVIELQFGFPEKWDKELMRRVLQWLDVDSYRPLFFEGDIDRVLYAMPVDGIDKIHNGLKQGYVNLTMKCSSSRYSSHDNYSQEYDTEELALLQGRTDYAEHVLNNKGYTTIYPEIWIEKIAKGNIEIRNETDGNRLFQLKNIDIGEKLYINNEQERIETSKERTYRYDDFNDNYFRMLDGENIIRMSPNMIIRFKYRFVYT